MSDTFAMSLKQRDSLRNAINKNDFLTVQSLLSSKLSLKLLNDENVLCFALISNRIDIAQLLLNYGVDINARNIDNWTAAMFISAYGTIECLNLLLENGADINLQCKENKSALIHATIKNRQDHISLLLSYGADVNICDSNNKTALDYTCNDEVRKMLLAAKHSLDYVLK